MDSTGLIFTENGEGRLVAMRPSAPASEDDLQDLIARFPDVIANEEGELLLIGREYGVPSTDGGYDRWSLDHLFVTKTAIPVFVEVKRASDTRIRREVIGQLLDYAASGVVYWPSGSLQISFERMCAEAGADPEEVLLQFLGNQEEDFWSQVQANLAAGRIRLLVVADAIPPELGRIIEFLNDQMRADVKAVELRYFTSQDGKRTLAPRFIGETEKAKLSKRTTTATLPSISVEEWISANLADLGETTIKGARNFLDTMSALGCEPSASRGQVSISTRAKADDGRFVAPFTMFSNSAIDVNFSYLKKRPLLSERSKRQEILDKLAAAVVELKSSNIEGLPSFYAGKLADPAAAAAFAEVAREFLDLARRTA